MALFECPECGNGISDKATKCPYCGANVKSLIKKIEKEKKQQKADELWKNTSPQGRAIYLATFFIVVILVIVFIANVGDSSYDSNDGECDICGKKATYKLNGEEFCYEDYKFALDYYLDD